MLGIVLCGIVAYAVRFAVEPQPTAGTAAGIDTKDGNGRTAAGVNLLAQSGDGKLVKDLTRVQIKL